MREVESYQHLKESLNVTASGAFNSGIYGGSAKASYFSSSDLNQFSTFMLVHVQVSNLTQGLTKYELTDAAKRVKHDQQAFFRLCGDSFVSAVTTGGEFYAVVEFKSRSEEQRKEISAKVRGSAGVWSFSGSFEQKMAYFSQFVETNIKIIRVGSTGDLPNLADADQGVSSLIAYATKFPTYVSTESKKAYPYSVTYEDYGVVDDFAQTPIDLQIQKQVLDELAEKKFHANYMQSKVNYILLNPDQFTNIDTQELNQSIDALSSITNQLNAAATKCFNHPFDDNGCVLPTGLPWPQISWPKRIAGLGTQALCDKELEHLHAINKLTTEQYQDLKRDNMAPQYKDPRDRSKGSVGIGYCSDVGVLLGYLWN